MSLEIWERKGTRSLHRLYGFTRGILPSTVSLIKDDCNFLVFCFPARRKLDKGLQNISPQTINVLFSEILDNIDVCYSVSFIGA